MIQAGSGEALKGKMSAHRYEEDISKNSFFIKLKDEYKILLETAAMEKWIICLPRQSSINLNDLKLN